MVPERNVMKTVTKTPDQLLKANLNKMLAKLKNSVANSEEIWLDIFQTLIVERVGVSGEDGTMEEEKETIKECGELADVALDVYEARWGQGGSKK